MRIEHADWKDGWHGLSIGLTIAEIDALMGLLAGIRADPEQHFHLTSTYQEGGGIGDIEVYVLTQQARHNMSLSGVALAPGDNIPNSPIE